LPKIEVFGGYSYLNRLTYHNTPDENPDFHGWEASVNCNFNKWVGLKVDFSGHYNTPCSPRMSDPSTTLHWVRNSLGG
jgi:hypothetical protein